MGITSAAIYRCNDVEKVFRYSSYQRKEFVLKNSLPRILRILDSIFDRLLEF